jgi:three-Cys-motif partner protein
MLSSAPNGRARGQDFVTASDGLPALLVSDHVREKEFAIERMIAIFNNGMQKKWNRRYYIDLFSGPGKCLIRGSREEVEGSPILAAKSRVQFTDYFLVDIYSDCLEALRTRINSLGLASQQDFNYYPGEADAVIDELVAELPDGQTSLGLAVIDPWGWDFSFETMAKLAAGRRLDLVINFPIVNIKRNWQRELPRLDKFMNGSSYRSSFKYAMTNKDPSVTATRVLLDSYQKELKCINYKYVNDLVGVTNSKGIPLYFLIFASKHDRGVDFWQKVTGIQESGQIRMGI